MKHGRMVSRGLETQQHRPNVGLKSNVGFRTKLAILKQLPSTGSGGIWKQESLEWSLL